MHIQATLSPMVALRFFELHRTQALGSTDLGFSHSWVTNWWPQTPPLWNGDKNHSFLFKSLRKLNEWGLVYIKHLGPYLVHRKFKIQTLIFQKHKAFKYNSCTSMRCCNSKDTLYVWKSSGAYILKSLLLSAHISSCIKNVLSGVPDVLGHVVRPHKSPFENHYNPSSFQSGGSSLLKGSQAVTEKCPRALFSSLGQRSTCHN